MLDDQIEHKALLQKQGTMTRMEKGMNKEHLKGYKANQTLPTVMIPGLQNESPLRSKVA